ncbi:hypothetical protein KIPB_002008 [Kipferlia bialata]|uniref:Uncharacterized protein n=1 Tax=Kipferlia bialata TaxID=797122 RepID=A0A9K3GFS9_9EUKA|nr:hypothetical protein KIPB_002008 [Kipferlia bialata]|eukprot:g2008.t1
MPVVPFTICVTNMGGTTLLECAVPQDYDPSTPLSVLAGVVETTATCGDESDPGSETEESGSEDESDHSYDEDQELEKTYPASSQRLQLLSSDTLAPIPLSTPLVMIQRALGSRLGPYNLIAQWVDDPRTPAERERETALEQGCCLSPQFPKMETVLSLAGVLLDPASVISDIKSGIINCLTAEHTRLVTAVKNKVVQFSPVAGVPDTGHHVCTHGGVLHLVTEGDSMTAYGIRASTSQDSAPVGDAQFCWSEVPVRLDPEASVLLDESQTIHLGPQSDGSLLVAPVTDGRLSHLLRLSVDPSEGICVNLSCTLSTPLVVPVSDRVYHTLRLSGTLDTAVVGIGGEYTNVCLSSGTVSRSAVTLPQICTPIGPVFYDPLVHMLCLATYDSTCVVVNTSGDLDGDILDTCALHGYCLYAREDSLISVDLRDYRFALQLATVSDVSGSQIPTLPESLDIEGAHLPPTLLAPMDGRVVAVSLDDSLTIMGVYEWQVADAKWGVLVAPKKRGEDQDVPIPALDTPAVCIGQHIYTTMHGQLLCVDLDTSTASLIPYALCGPVLAHPDGRSLVLMTHTGYRRYRVLPEERVGDVDLVPSAHGSGMGEYVGHSILNGLAPAEGQCNTDSVFRGQGGCVEYSGRDR